MERNNSHASFNEVAAITNQSFKVDTDLVLPASLKAQTLMYPMH